MKLRYNYKLLPNKKQKLLLQNHFFSVNQSFNICLNLNLNQYDNNLIKKSNNEEPSYLSSTELDFKIKEILTSRNIEYNTKVIQQARKNFQDSMGRYFKSFSGNNIFGKLKFKISNKNYGNLETTSEQYKIIDYINVDGTVSTKWKVLRLFNQSFKIRWTRDLPSEPKTLTIKLKDNNYYISFVSEFHKKFRKTKYNKTFEEASGNPDKLSKVDLNKLKSAGLDINLFSIDLGNKSFYKVFKVNSNKKIILMNEIRIKTLKRKQSKRALKALKESKSSKTKFALPNSFNKTQIKINKLQRKVVNKKNFNLHQLINDLMKGLLEKKINHLIIEDLDVKSMTDKKNVNKLLGKRRTKSMRKNILQVSFGQMKDIIIYKCAMNNIYLSLVDPKNTSKTCSNQKCNHINTNLQLSDRLYICQKCKLEINRDYNSALNIMQKGLIRPG